MKTKLANGFNVESRGGQVSTLKGWGTLVSTLKVQVAKFQR